MKGSTVLLMTIVSFVSCGTIQERMTEVEKGIEGWRKLVVSLKFDVADLKTKLRSEYTVNLTSFFANKNVGEKVLGLGAKKTTPGAVDTKEQQLNPAINPGVVDIFKNSPVIKGVLEENKAQKGILDLKFLFAKEGSQQKELVDFKKVLADLTVKDVLSQDAINSNISTENTDLLSKMKIGDIFSKAESSQGDEKKISGLLAALKIDELIDTPSSLDPKKMASIENSLAGLKNRLAIIKLEEVFAHQTPNLGVIMLKVHEVEINNLKNDSERESSYRKNLDVLEYLMLSLFIETRPEIINFLKQRFLEMLKVHLFVFEKPGSSRPQQPSDHFLSFINGLSTKAGTFDGPVTLSKDMQDFASELPKELAGYTQENLQMLDIKLIRVRQSLDTRFQEYEASFKFTDLATDFGTQIRLLV